MARNTIQRTLQVSLVLALLVLGSTWAQVNRAAFIQNILTRAGYDSRVRPFVEEGRPTTIDVEVFFSSISSINEVNMEYTVEIYLRQRWQDPRLAFAGYNNSITLSYQQFHLMWVPDLFVTNEKSARFHQLTVPNRLLRISPEGKILYSQRLTFILSCNMELTRFPLDNQTCRFNMESYGYTTEDVRFRWNLDVEKPVQVRSSLKLSEFTLVKVIDGDCTAVYTTGAFTCIFAELHFKRELAFYLIQTYIPSLLIVMLSWVSFWIEYHAVPARITLGLLTVLTITTQSSGLNLQLPRVSYVKAIDVWMTTCLAFVFGAMIEYSIVNVVARKQRRMQQILRQTAAAAAVAEKEAKRREKARREAKKRDRKRKKLGTALDDDASSSHKKRKRVRPEGTHDANYEEKRRARRQAKRLAKAHHVQDHEANRDDGTAARDKDKKRGEKRAKRRAKKRAKKSGKRPAGRLADVPFFGPRSGATPSHRYPLNISLPTSVNTFFTDLKYHVPSLHVPSLHLGLPCHKGGLGTKRDSSADWEHERESSQATNRKLSPAIAWLTQPPPLIFDSIYDSLLQHPFEMDEPADPETEHLKLRKPATGLPGEIIMPPGHGNASSKFGAWWQMVRANKAMKIDVLSRGGFPAMFVLFATAYWMYYT